MTRLIDAVAFEAWLDAAAAIIAPRLFSTDTPTPAQIEDAKQGCRQVGDQERQYDRNPSIYMLCLGAWVRSGAHGIGVDALEEIEAAAQAAQVRLQPDTMDTETPPAPAPGDGPLAALHVDGLVFRLPDGSIWPWRGATSFLLFKRFLDGEDLAVLVGEFRGATILRVLGMCDNIAHFHPQEIPGYFDQVTAFLRAVNAFGVRVEFVVFADAQIVMPAFVDQLDHARRVWHAIVDAGDGLNLIEWANEPFKNGVDVARLQHALGTATGSLEALGTYDVVDGQLPHADYLTVHTDRGPEWPRKAKDLLELRDGFEGFAGVHCPVVGDEPIGADELDKPGSRSNVPDDFFWYAACAQLMGAGATFHSTDGVYSLPLGRVQSACAAAFFAGAAAIPPEAQLGRYTRGGLADCPIQFTETDALRVYARITGNTAYVVAIRPSAGWQAIAVDGWRIVQRVGPQGSVLTLER
jgi:hypothetical protein